MPAYYNRGQAKLSLHDYQGAIVDYSAAISLDPKYGKYYFARGMARFALKDYGRSNSRSYKVNSTQTGTH